MRLKQFNPNKELKKLNRKYTKKHLIISLIALVLLISIGSSYAIFSIQPEYHTFIKGTVGEFSTGDIKLFVTVEGEKRDEFPAKGSGYGYKSVTCKNGGTGIWDNDNWQIKLSVNGPDECTINFKEVNLIQFTILGTEYVAEEGMTWKEWANSSYCNDAIIVDEYNVRAKDGMFLNKPNKECQFPDMIIDPNINYISYQQCSGGV